MKKMALNNEKGFVLLAAIVACLIILAIGMIVINMSTGNLIASSITVGDKKALAAAESGIHSELRDFDHDHNTWVVAVNKYTSIAACASNDTANYNWRTITGGTDANTKFVVCAPVKGPNVTLPHDSTASLCTYSETVIGENTNYKSLARVTIGIGVYCPGVNSATATTYR